MVQRVVGRYAIFDELAHGGMATVHVGRLRGAAGFARTVAIKRLHTQYARDPAFVSMLVDEARLAARIKHPNVVPVLDVVTSDGELFLVMDYVAGETVSRLIVRAAQEDTLIPPDVASSIMSSALLGLHAAHEANSEFGEHLGIVHRDVSPQNIMVGLDGVSRVFDFGVAKAAQRSQTTHDGALKGKIGYMSPEQLHGERIDRRSDIYAAGVVLWEILVGQRLFLTAEGQPALLLSLTQTVRAPSTRVPGLPERLDAVVLRALERDPNDRFQSALDMARAIEAAVEPASPVRVGAWLRDLASDALATKARLIARIESVGGLSPLDSTGELPATIEEPTAVDSSPPAFAQPGTQPGAIVPAQPLPADATQPRRNVLVLLVSATAVLVVLAGVWSLAFRRGELAQVPQPAPNVSRSASAPSVQAPPLPLPSAPGSAPTSGSELAGAASTAAPSATPGPATASVRVPRGMPAPAADCNPPFTLDAQGHKRYKRECFPK